MKIINNYKNFISQRILPLLPFRSYSLFAYIATAVTGFAALCSQVIWQKHLAILTGSEALSLSLVLAVFLMGLAGGYYLFGLLTERKSESRSLLLKYYGYVEMATGIYIALFPFYFEFLKGLSFHSPNHIAIDIFLALLALLIPTVLMGASIPCLTATLPDKSEEINNVHSKVYGWNALGACLGTLIAGFYLIPNIGLNVSLIFIGIINILASFVFIGNKLNGSVQKQEDPQNIPSPLPYSFFMIFVFFTGALTLSFEVIFVRILNLSLGAGFHNFPLVLCVFIAGISLGSLSLKKENISHSFLTRQILIILLLLELLFITAPYWSIWFNHIRISMSSLPSNYTFFYIFIFLFLMIFLFPLVFFLGRLLPLSYMFLKKTKDNYGKLCGKLYFSNTLGTVFGAIFLGYLAFYIFNLDAIFFFNKFIFLLLVLPLFVFIKNKIYLSLFFILSVTSVFLYQFTQWDRTGHIVGYFRTNTYKPNMHFRGLFHLPKIISPNSRVSFFKDGPNSTVSLINYFEIGPPETIQRLKNLFRINNVSSYSIIVNGKSDGNSLGDFSTVFLMLPYLHSAEKPNLRTAFIGLGTGLSAGTYTPLEDVKSIDVLEISPYVIKAIQSLPPELNFSVMDHPKVKVIETDAFKYFTRNNKKFDIVISEPSNPWVLGVENLFTKDFYELVARNLNPEGVFGQWIHTYSMDLFTLEIVIKTVKEVFPHATLYKVGHQDLLIVASQQELKALSKERFNKPFVNNFYKALGMEELEDVYLSQIFNPRQMYQIASLSQQTTNSLIAPQLIYRASKALFLDIKSEITGLITKAHPKTNEKTIKMRAFEKYKNTEPALWNQRCMPLSGFNFFCAVMHEYQIRWQNLTDENQPIGSRFDSYIFLRQHNLIPYDEAIMKEVFEEILKQGNVNLNTLSNYISQKIQMGDYTGADRDSSVFKERGIINNQHYSNFRMDLEQNKRMHHLLNEGPAQ